MIEWNSEPFLSVFERGHAQVHAVDLGRLWFGEPSLREDTLCYSQEKVFRINGWPLDGAFEEVPKRVEKIVRDLDSELSVMRVVSPVALPSDILDSVSACGWRLTETNTFTGRESLVNFRIADAPYTIAKQKRRQMRRAEEAGLRVEIRGPSHFSPAHFEVWRLLWDRKAAEMDKVARAWNYFLPEMMRLSTMFCFEAFLGERMVGWSILNTSLKRAAVQCGGFHDSSVPGVSTVITARHLEFAESKGFELFSMGYGEPSLDIFKQELGANVFYPPGRIDPPGFAYDFSRGGADTALWHLDLNEEAVVSRLRAASLSPLKERSGSTDK